VAHGRLGHGDRSTNEAFAPLATYAERIGALLDDVAALGFQAVDVWGAHLNPEWATDAHVDLAAAALDERGLTVAAYEVFVAPAHLERACRIAQRLGTSVLSGFVPAEDERLPALLEQRGLRVALENHPEPTPEAMLERVGGRPHAGVCVDTGWFATQGYDPARAIEELGGLVFHVHLKDVLREGEPHETCAWGEGVVDVKACVRALQRVGYTGAFTVEHEPEDHDPSEEIRAMREQLEAWLG